VRAAIVGASGFAEAGTAEGHQRQDEIAWLARRAGMRLIGPNTNGIYNGAARLSLGYNAAHGYAIPIGPVRSFPIAARCSAASFAPCSRLASVLRSSSR